MTKKNLLLLQSAAYVGVAVGGAWGLFTCAVGLAKLVPPAPADNNVSRVDAEPVGQHPVDDDLPTCAELELAAETDPVP